MCLSTLKSPLQSSNTDWYQTTPTDNRQPLCYLYGGNRTLTLQPLSSRKFAKKFREKSNSMFDLAHSSGFSVQMQEEVFRKSSQAACSCCHCQKQSGLLGLHSRSRRSRGAGKYSGQFSACWIKCLINTWRRIQQLFISRHIVYRLPSDRDTWTYSQERIKCRQQYTNTYMHTVTHMHISLHIWVDLCGSSGGPFDWRCDLTNRDVR